MKANKIIGIVGLVFLIIGIVVIFYKRNQFMKDYKLVNGTVTEITGPGWKSSGDYSVLFKYSIGNIEYRRNDNYNYCNGLGMSKIKALLVGKQFPVAYSTNDPGTSTMLITLKNIARFDRIQTPDSLRLYDSILTCKKRY